MVAHGPDLAGDLAQEMPVVGDHEDGARIVAQRPHERFAAFEVQVVGGFVQDEEIGPVGKKSGQNEPGFLTTGEFAHPPLPVVLAQQKQPQNGTDFQVRGLGSGHAPHLGHDRRVGVQDFGLVLAEITDLDPGTEDDPTFDRFEHPGHEL